MPKMLMISLAALLLSACATGTTVIAPDCLFARVIFIGDDDVLTEQTADQILEHNLNVEDICQ